MTSAGCTERLRLMRECTEAAALFKAAVDMLSQAMDSANQAAFDEMRTIAEVARERMEQARGSLAQHKAEHGC